MRLKAKGTSCHGRLCILPWHRGLPHKGILSSETELTKQSLWQWELQTPLCCPGRCSVLQSLVSKFRISSRPAPQIINSGLCSQPLPLICAVCPAFLSTGTHRITVLCPLLFLQQTFLHRIQLLLLSPITSSHK